MRIAGITGSSGSGKTRLIALLVPVLKGRGLRVSVIKHAHHGFDMDRPGKDSFRFREAGAEEVMVAAQGRWVLQREVREEEELSPAALAARMAPVDVLLVEGFKLADIPKIEVFRPSLGKAPYFAGDAGIVAVASDEAMDAGGRVVLPLNEPGVVADFILGLEAGR